LFDLEDPSPNPANPAQYAYLGCEGSGGSNAIAVSQGASHQGFSFDDAPQRGVGWRSDGGLVVASEGGTEPGLWTYTPVPGNANPVYVLNGDFPGDVAFAGAANERILFTSGAEIWTLPASCTAATCTSRTRRASPTRAGTKARPCGRRPPAEPVAKSGRKGRNVFRFAKVARKKFKKGKYRVTIKTGGESAVVSFTVKR
jgi:hypothetical protein